jgi:hypothetical protein
MPRSRNGDFKYFYSNSFGVSVSNEEMIIRFGVFEDPSNPNDSICEQVAVVVSLTGGKTLMQSLAAVIQRFEEGTKTTIPFSQERVAEIQASVAEIPSVRNPTDSDRKKP